ncbi:MAG: iron-containing alcohol dehydrogenase, partial [Burkholderiales bacterium]
MQTLQVELGERTYPIHIGQGLLRDADLLVTVLAQPRVVIVTNTTLAQLHLRSLANALEARGIGVLNITLPDGEEYKNGATLNLIYDALLQNRAERNTTLLALGGGVIGDLTGYAAATYL